MDSDGPGRGASFSFELPLAASARLSAPLTDSTPRPPQRDSTATGEGAQISGLKVLVVDDEADARELVKRLLESGEAVVSTAGSAAEAMQLLERERYDVLVSDLGMPGEDGHSLIRKVRALTRAQGGDLPAVALTAYARAEERAKAQRAGFQEHVTKPVEPSLLISTVAELARRHSSA